MIDLMTGVGIIAATVLAAALLGLFVLASLVVVAVRVVSLNHELTAKRNRKRKA